MKQVAVFVIICAAFFSKDVHVVEGTGEYGNGRYRNGGYGNDEVVIGGNGSNDGFEQYSGLLFITSPR